MQTRTLCRWSFLPTLAAALAPALLGAQSERASADSVLHRDGPAGSVAVSLNASVDRYGGSATTYGVGVGALPFLTDHVQLGVGASYAGIRNPGYGTIHNSGAVLVGNYVVGAGARWRGYAGGYAGGNSTTGVDGRSVTGVQVGALYFLDPAVAVQAEYGYGRVLDDVRRAFGQVNVGLTPFLFGRASAVAPTPAGLGMLDVAVNGYVHNRDGGARGASARVAPYLTRWLQLGGAASVDRYGYSYITPGGSGTLSLTSRDGSAFARAYLPLGARLQPFAGGFVGHRTTVGAGGFSEGVSRYGPTVGARYLLNARVALDGALERRFFGDYTGSVTGSPRIPDQTAFTVGLATRFGRAR